MRAKSANIPISQQPPQGTSAPMAVNQPEHYSAVYVNCAGLQPGAYRSEGRPLHPRRRAQSQQQEANPSSSIACYSAGGREAFTRRKKLPHTLDACSKENATNLGYEPSLTRHFHMPKARRTPHEIASTILAIQKAVRLLDRSLKGATG